MPHAGEHNGIYHGIHYYINYGTVLITNLYSPLQDIYVIVMEYLNSENYSLMNTAKDTSVWTLSDIKVAGRICWRSRLSQLWTLGWQDLFPYNYQFTMGNDRLENPVGGSGWLCH